MNECTCGNDFEAYERSGRTLKLCGDFACTLRRIAREHNLAQQCHDRGVSLPLGQTAKNLRWQDFLIPASITYNQRLIPWPSLDYAWSREPGQPRWFDQCIQHMHSIFMREYGRHQCRWPR